CPRAVAPCADRSLVGKPEAPDEGLGNGASVTNEEEQGSGREQPGEERKAFDAGRLGNHDRTVRTCLEKRDETVADMTFERGPCGDAVAPVGVPATCHGVGISND